VGLVIFVCVCGALVFGVFVCLFGVVVRYCFGVMFVFLVLAWGVVLVIWGSVLGGGVWMVVFLFLCVGFGFVCFCVGVDFWYGVLGVVFYWVLWFWFSGVYGFGVFFLGVVVLGFGCVCGVGLGLVGVFRGSGCWFCVGVVGGGLVLLLDFFWVVWGLFYLFWFWCGLVGCFFLFVLGFFVFVPVVCCVGCGLGCFVVLRYGLELVVCSVFVFLFLVVVVGGCWFLFDCWFDGLVFFFCC